MCGSGYCDECLSPTVLAGEVLVKRSVVSIRPSAVSTLVSEKQTDVLLSRCACVPIVSNDHGLPGIGD